MEQSIWSRSRVLIGRLETLLADIHCSDGVRVKNIKLSSEIPTGLAT